MSVESRRVIAFLLCCIAFFLGTWLGSATDGNLLDFGIAFSVVSAMLLALVLMYQVGKASR